MKKIITIGILAGIVATISMAKPPCYGDDFFKKFPKWDYTKYKNSSPQRWSQNCLGGVHPSSHVPLGVANISVHIGCGNSKSATKYRFKVIVHQTNPCFVTISPNNYPVKITKVDSNTIEIISKRKEWCDVNLFNYGRRGLDYVYNPINPKRVKNILGNSLECLKQSNRERWDIYTQNRDGSWREVGRYDFFIDAKHPLLEQVGIDPTNYKVTK